MRAGILVAVGGDALALVDLPRSEFAPDAELGAVAPLDLAAQLVDPFASASSFASRASHPGAGAGSIAGGGDATSADAETISRPKTRAAQRTSARRHAAR